MRSFNSLFKQTQTLVNTQASSIWRTSSSAVSGPRPSRSTDLGSSNSIGRTQSAQRLSRWRSVLGPRHFLALRTIVCRNWICFPLPLSWHGHCSSMVVCQNSSTYCTTLLPDSPTRSSGPYSTPLPPPGKQYIGRI